LSSLCFSFHELFPEPVFDYNFDVLTHDDPIIEASFPPLTKEEEKNILPLSWKERKLCAEHSMFFSLHKARLQSQLLTPLTHDEPISEASVLPQVGLEL